MGVRTKLLLPTVLTFFLIAFLIQFVWVNDYMEHERESWKNNQITVINILKKSIRHYLLTEDFGALFSLLNSTLDNNSINWISFQVIDHQRKLTYSSSVTPGTEQDEIVSMKSEIVWEGRHLATIKVLSNITPVLKEEKEGISYLMMGTLLVVAIFIVLAVLLQNRLIRLPLARLQYAAARLARGDANVPLSQIGNDEIGQLTQTFVSMRTKLQSALQQVQASEIRYRAVFDNAIDGIITVDRNGCIISMNRAAEKLFGYRNDEVVNKSFKVLLPEPYCTEYIQYLYNYLETGQAKILGVTRDIEGHRKNGTKFDLSLAVSEIRHGDDSIFCAVAHDISERLDIQQKIRRTNDLMTSLVNNLQLGIMVEDQNHNILQVNQLFCDLFEITTNKEELAGTSSMEYLNLISPYFSEEYEFLESTQRHLAWKEVVICEELMLADGRYLERDYIPVSLGNDSDNEQFAHLWCYRDITGRKRIEAAVRAQSQQLAIAAKEEKSLSGLLRLALAPTDLNQYLQEALQEILSAVTYGRYHAEGAILLCDKGNPGSVTLKSSHISTLSLKEDCKQLSNLYCHNDYVEEMSASSCHDIFRNKVSKTTIDNYKRHYLPLTQNDVILGAIILYFPLMSKRTEDDLKLFSRLADVTSLGITRRYDNKALLHAKIEAESAAQAKSAFLATMSHEIRTPMNGVLGMAQILDSTELTDTQRHYLNTITSSGKALLVIINDILDYSKIEAGKMVIENLSFNLERTAHEVCNLLAGMVREKGLELILNYDSKCPRSLTGDASRLRQVLMNLIGNAIKFTQTGYILIDIRCETIINDLADIKISIQDTGIGISEKAQQNLFKSFTQADDSTTRRFGGTGLGLAISRQLLGLMNGEMYLESKENEGSTFWLKIPLTIDNDKGISPHPMLTGKRALIVDDLAINRQMFQQQLQALGMQTEVASNLQSCLRHLSNVSDRENQFDIILIDEQLQYEKGYIIAEKIRAYEQCRTIPLVLLSDTIQRADTNTLMDAGFSSYLVKPVHSDMLANTLSAVLKGHTPNATTLIDIRQDIFGETSNASTFKGKVLLVEDVTFNQQVAMTMLEQMGLDVDIVDNGQSAIDRHDSERYDMIFMDCQMPIMDGFEATRKIRQHELNNSERTPIVALTANATESDRQQCFDAGMDDFLIKPFEKDSLINMVARYIKNDTSIRDRQDSVLSMTLTHELKNRPHFDEQKFTQLIALLGENIRPLVESFINNSRARMKILTKAITDEQVELIGNTAHTLSDISGNIGANAMHLIASELVRRASEISKEEATVYADNIEKHFSQVCQWFDDNQESIYTASKSTMMAKVETKPLDAIDNEKFESVRQTLGEQIFAQLIPTFLTSAAELLDNINQAYTDNNTAELRRYAHSLKSASANVGALRMSEFAASLESSISGASSIELTEIIADLQQEFEAVDLALQKKTA